MRQLKGKATKENAKMKRERRQAFREGHNQVLTVALPVLIGVALLVVLYVVMVVNKKKTGVEL